MAAIEGHFTRHVAAPAFVVHELESVAVHVDVHVVRPGDRHPYWLLFTTGMSARPMALPADEPASRWAELAMLLPSSWKLDRESMKRTEWSWLVTTLRFLARAPHVHRDAWLAAGTTIANGAPLDPSTAFAGVLLWPPSSFPGSIEVGNKLVQLLTVWPLCEEELALAEASCAHCVLDGLELAGVTEVLDPRRISAV